MQEANRAPAGVFSKEDTGRRIDTWLVQHNPMSTREAARRCGIPFETMRRYRTGQMRPSVAMMEKLAKIGLTPSYVYGKNAEERVQFMLEKAEDKKVMADYMRLSAEGKKAVKDLIEIFKEGNTE